ncbi:hypothetical protein HanPI659440_Chr09g0323031 [Helianthus annuus]|nr:hypothetical protein HanPI659440_Chr09g0323031 [Helianthus annuus]
MRVRVELGTNPYRKSPKMGIGSKNTWYEKYMVQFDNGMVWYMKVKTDAMCIYLC